MLRMQNPALRQAQDEGDIIYKLPALLLVIALLQSQRHEHQQRQSAFAPVYAAAAKGRKIFYLSKK